MDTETNNVKNKFCFSVLDFSVMFIKKGYVWIKFLYLNNFWFRIKMVYILNKYVYETFIAYTLDDQKTFYDIKVQLSSREKLELIYYNPELPAMLKNIFDENA